MESLVTQHSADILQILLWAFIVVGGAFVSILVWIGKRVADKLDAIEKQIGKTNTTLSAIERDIRGELIVHDRRLSRVEAQIEAHQSLCSAKHGDSNGKS